MPKMILPVGTVRRLHYRVSQKSKGPLSIYPRTRLVTVVQNSQMKKGVCGSVLKCAFACWLLA